MSHIHVAVGIIINSQNKILIALRPTSKIMPNIWEFPGGKLEKNETVLQALQRELKEEINIDVVKAEPLMTTQYQYLEKTIFLDVWKVTQFNGEPFPCEGQAEIKWAVLTELTNLTMPPGNQEILSFLSQHLI